ncbi:MAG: bacillithiol system redox-active protein YtxJ [Clostridiaceae bacterium]|nr:bacillithiol system redox-active protein YtxJ [Clostridiaceae bacterium]
MAKGVKKITLVEDLHKIIKKSSKKPIFLFKHDVTIQESQDAFEEYLQFVEDNEEDILATMVDVREYVEISDEIEEVLEIGHEAPQIMLLMDEEVVWDDDKNNITLGRLIEVVNEYIFI